MSEDPAEETVEGVLTRILFTSDDETFRVALLKQDGGVELKAVGDLSGLHEGERVRLVGLSQHTARFGARFKVTAGYPILPHTADGIRQYLASGRIKGIGAGLAERLVARFGADTLRVIEREPDRLAEVPGIGPVRSHELSEAFVDQRTQREALLFLQSKGLSASLAQRVFRRYHGRTISLVRENPYRLSEEVSGIGFATADALARGLGVAPDSPVRCAAGLIHLLAAARDEGHLYLPRAVLTERALRLLGPTAPIADVLALLLNEGRLISDGAPPPEDALYTRAAHRDEVEAAALLKRLAEETLPPLDANLDAFSEKTGLVLADAQRQAVEVACQSAVFVLTGGPGTGKTTIVRALVAALEASGPVALAAPTGRAARRLSEATGAQARTLHRLLEYTPAEDAFRRDADTPLEVQAIVIDEASMVDLSLFVATLRAIPPCARLILVGDADQLPSVGAGNVLGDLLASGALPSVRLTEVFRQASQSRIVQSAHRILAGALPQAPAEGEESDFFVVRARDAAHALELVGQLVTTRIPQRFGFNPQEEVQVLVPMHRGLCGAKSLNAHLQALLNPGPAPEGDTLRLRTGDKVMQVRNDYEREIFNGDLGWVVAEGEASSLTVRFEERLLAIDREARASLVPAYAVTIHKSQGSEYPAVVIPVLDEHWVMLQRNLLYTAVTRGRKLVVLVVQDRALSRAVKVADAGQRYSALAARLQP